MLYPFKFEDIFKGMPRYIWGGRNLTAIGKSLPSEGTVAESWEVSCNPAGLSVISNGEYKGAKLITVIEELGDKIVGDIKVFSDYKKFPLLIKFIDANDDLSIQAHPGDDYARSVEHEAFGKNEMWYVVAANPGANLIYDVVPGTTRETFKRLLENNRVLECLQTVPVSPGDFINIPAGLLHAIGKGIVLAEIQQNSDLTYRVFDYNRTDPNGNLRPLHIDKALDVVNFGETPGVAASESVTPNARKTKYAGLTLTPESGNSRTIGIANKYFAVEKFDISSTHKEFCDGRKFFIMIALSGSAEITFDGGAIEFASGESMLIPACLGEYSIKGKITYLKTYVPDIEADVITPLLDAGFSKSDIIGNVGGIANIK